MWSRPPVLKFTGMQKIIDRSGFAAAVFIAVAAALAPGAAIADRAPPANQEQVTLSFAPIVRHAAPAVVNIYAQRTVKQQPFSSLFNDPLFKRFFGEDFPFGGAPRERIQKSLGSGVLVGADGVVVTNNHVIAGAEEIKIVLHDRREYAAEVLLADKRTDIAVLRIDTGGESLPILDFGDSDELEVGDLVLALGNPFGVGQTVTSGIVSALARTGVGVADYRFFIQTDAAINPGNSGGALVGMNGRLIGVNTAIFSKSGGSLGIGFAVPSNMVRAIVESAIEGRELVRPWLGFDGRAVTAELAQALGMARPNGVIVENIYPDGPADDAGLRSGDVVTEVDGKDVEDIQALRFRLATRRIGETASLTVIRKGRERKRRFPLVAPPEEPPKNTTILEGDHPLSGASIANLSPALDTELGLNTTATGVIVLKVVKRSRASRLGLRPGDLIVKINGKAMELVRDVVGEVESGASKWSLAINRNGRIRKVVVQ